MQMQHCIFVLVKDAVSYKSKYTKYSSFLFFIMRLIKISVYISNLFDYEEMNISDLGHYQSPCSTKDSKNTQFFLMEMNWKLPVCDHFMIDNTVLKPFIMALN